MPPLGVEDGPQGGEDGRQPTARPRLPRPEELRQRVAGQSTRPADEELEQVSCLAGLPGRRGHGVAVAQHREGTQAPDPDPGRRQRLQGHQRTGDAGGVVAHAQGEQPLPSQLLGTRVPGQPTGEHLVDRQADRVLDLGPDRGGLGQAVDDVGARGAGHASYLRERPQLEGLGEPRQVVAAPGLALGRPRLGLGLRLVTVDQRQPAGGEHGGDRPQGARAAPTLPPGSAAPRPGRRPRRYAPGRTAQGRAPARSRWPRPSRRPPGRPPWRARRGHGSGWCRRSSPAPGRAAVRRAPGRSRGRRRARPAPPRPDRARAAPRPG